MAKTKRRNTALEPKSGQQLDYEAKQVYYEWLDSLNFCVQKYLCSNFFKVSSDYVEIKKRDRFNLTYLNYYFQPKKVYLSRKRNIENLFMIGIKSLLNEKSGLEIEINGRTRNINKTIIGQVLR